MYYCIAGNIHEDLFHGLSVSQNTAKSNPLSTKGDFSHHKAHVDYDKRQLSCCVSGSYVWSCFVPRRRMALQLNYTNASPKAQASPLRHVEDSAQMAAEESFHALFPWWTHMFQVLTSALGNTIPAWMHLQWQLQVVHSTLGFQACSWVLRICL